MTFEARVPTTTQVIDKSFIDSYDVYLRRRRAHHHDFCERVIGAAAPGTLVDISMGWGHAAFDILKQIPGLKLLTVGWNELVLQKARENAVEEGVIERWKSLRLEGEELPFSQDSVDAIVSTNALRRFVQPRYVLEEMWRVIKPGGKVYISDLRRDANQSIANYIERQLSEDKSPFGKLSYELFMTSWGSAYTIEEAREMLTAAQIATASVEEDGAMSMCIEFEKR